MEPMHGARKSACASSGRLALILIAAAVAPAATTLEITPERGLAAAREAVREMRRGGSTEPVTVLLRGGVYRLNETFVLTAEDSDCTYANYPGERPIVSGGRRIEGWEKGKGSIWTAPAPWSFRQLFVGGRRAQRARTPTNGFYRIDGPSSQDKPFQLKYRGNDIQKSWESRDVEVVALLAWAEIRMPIVAVDEEARIATLSGNPRPSNKEKDARYWIENSPDALDAAGEWHLDRDAGVVSYWPMSGEDLTKEEVIAPALTQLVRLEGARNVVFRGLDFRHADWSMAPEGYADAQAATQAPSAFEATGAENVSIENCVFTQSGGYAIWFGRGSKRNRLVANQIFDMGGGGVKIGETVQRSNEADQNFENVISDNDIHALGSVYPAAVGIWVAQSGRNAIAHNHVHDLYYTAISVGWTWGYGANQSKGNRIEYNHLHHIGRDMLSDMGAIYTLGMQPGTVIRNNLIHDVWAFTYGGWGIYPDEGSSEMLIENNVVYRTKSAGFHQHYGRENVVRNNVFAFGKEYQLMRTRAEPHRSFSFEGNIVYFDSGKLLGSNWSGDQYRMDRNIYWDVRGGAIRPAGRSWEDWQKLGQDTGSAIADPQFVNAAAYDFALKPESPAWKMGWQAIDLSGVGPRVSPGLPASQTAARRKGVLMIADELPAMETLAAQLRSKAGVASTIVRQAELPRDLSAYRAVIVYIHKNLDEPVEKACIEYARAGGKLVLLHHSISSAKRQNRYWFDFLGVSLPAGDVGQGGYKWVEGAQWEVINRAPRHYVTTHGAPPSSFALANSEVYLNHVLQGPRTVLLGLKYTDPKSGVTYQQDTAGWLKQAGKGMVFYFMPGHHAREFENPAYIQILVNAIASR